MSGGCSHETGKLTAKSLSIPLNFQKYIENILNYLSFYLFTLLTALIITAALEKVL